MSVEHSCERCMSVEHSCELCCYQGSIGRLWSLPGQVVECILAQKYCPAGLQNMFHPSFQFFLTDAHIYPSINTGSFTMLFTILVSLVATTAAADVPSCARRGLFDWSSATALQALLQPPLQIDGNRCANVCRLSPLCGSFASSTNQLSTDWCLIFRQGT